MDSRAQGAAPALGEPTTADASASAARTPYDWTGFYLGGNLGYGFGNSNWSAGPGASGSFSISQPIDSFSESGSVLGGVQAGYNYMLPNRFLLGAEIDATFPGYQTLTGLSTGNIANFTSPAFGPQSYTDTLLWSGSARLRLGYAPGDWLFYVTGGLAWAQDQWSLTQLSTGASGSTTGWRVGWAAGAGVEVPILPNWTARAEYLFSDFGRKTVAYGNGLQSTSADLALSELRVGVNYQFGGNPFDPQPQPASSLPSWASWASDNVSLHGQAT
jgi:high affinity Mn2+ porin